MNKRKEYTAPKLTCFVPDTKYGVLSGLSFTPEDQKDNEEIDIHAKKQDNMFLETWDDPDYE